MTRHRFGAIAACLALGLTSISPTLGLAQAKPAATAASLQSTISAAARAAASKPGFAALTPAQKQAALQAAIAAAMAESGATPEVISAALVSAVASGTISAGVAVSVAAQVAPEMAQQVASAPAVVAQLQATGQTVTVSTTTNAQGAPSVLVSLQGATNTSSPDNNGAPASGTSNPPAPFDPCAGVIAAYCGA